MKKHAKPIQAGLKFGDLRLSWLETFVVVSRSDSRSSAALKLGITQSAVTKHLQNLERWSQKVLVDSNSFPTKLTEQGEALVPIADDVVGVMARARKPPVPTDGQRVRISAKDIRLPPSVPKAPTD